MTFISKILLPTELHVVLQVRVWCWFQTSHAYICSVIYLDQYPCTNTLWDGYHHLLLSFSNFHPGNVYRYFKFLFHCGLFLTTLKIISARCLGCLALSEILGFSVFLNLQVGSLYFKLNIFLKTLKCKTFNFYCLALSVLVASIISSIPDNDH